MCNIKHLLYLSNSLLLVVLFSWSWYFWFCQWVLPETFWKIIFCRLLFLFTNSTVPNSISHPKIYGGFILLWVRVWLIPGFNEMLISRSFASKYVCSWLPSSYFSSMILYIIVVTQRHWAILSILLLMWHFDKQKVWDLEYKIGCCLLLCWLSGWLWKQKQTWKQTWKEVFDIHVFTLCMAL